MKVCRELKYLHPLVQAQFTRLNDRLISEYHRGLSVFFKPFETYRSPVRQNHLYQQGRSEPGRIVTNAKPWESPHQFGLAVDFVPYRPKNPDQLNGPWVWDWDYAKDADWAFLASCAAKEGLSSNIAWDRPHVEARDIWGDFRTIIQYRKGIIGEVIEVDFKRK